MNGWTRFGNQSPGSSPHMRWKIPERAERFLAFPFVARKTALFHWLIVLGCSFGPLRATSGGWLYCCLLACMCDSWQVGSLWKQRSSPFTTYLRPSTWLNVCSHDGKVFVVITSHRLWCGDRSFDGMLVLGHAHQEIEGLDHTEILASRD